MVTPNLKKGFFAVTTYYHLCLLICEVRWFEEGHVVDITECFVQMLEKDQCETLKSFFIIYRNLSGIYF